MLLSAVSVLVVAQSSSKIPEGLMNNPVLGQSGNVVLEEHGENQLGRSCEKWRCCRESSRRGISYIR